MSRDAIEREIFIRADIDYVWSLVSKVGFWIGDDLHFDTDANEGDLVPVVTTGYGTFPVRVDRLEAPRYAAYRWASGYPGSEPTETNSTLVEFTLVEQNGGVILRLKESGFATIDSASDARDTMFDNNDRGWSLQLDKFNRAAEEVAVG